MASRCYSCCQENCHFKTKCFCSCHNEPVPTEFPHNHLKVLGFDKLKSYLPADNPVELLLYAVRNEKGKWYASGYGRNLCWRDDASQASLYVKISQARARVTELTNNSKHSSKYELIEFKATMTGVIDEAARVAEAVSKKQREETARAAATKAMNIKDAKLSLARAQERLDKLLVAPRRRCSACGHDPHPPNACPDETWNGYSCRCKSDGDQK